MRVDVLFGVDDVAALRGDEAGGGGDDARLVGTREEQDRVTWRSFYRRNAKQATAVAAAAFSESTPSAIGIRTGVASVEQFVAQPGPLRSDQDGRAVGRADGRRSSTAVRVGRHRVELQAVEERASSSARCVVRAWGSANAVPIATRSDRRASGSALVWSRISPSQPNAAALRMIEPTLAGLSTASSTTRRRPMSASCGDRRAGRALEQRHDRVRVPEPGDDPAHVDRRRRRRGSRASAASGRHASVSTSAATGTQPAVEGPLDHEVALGEEQAGAGVVALLGAARQPRSFSRNCRNRGSSGSSIGMISTRRRPRHHVCVAISEERYAEIADANVESTASEVGHQ